MNMDSLPRYPGGPLKRYPDGYLATEYEALLEWACETASPLAVDEALNVAHPDSSIFSLEIPQEFGQKWAEELTLCRSELLEQDEDTLLELLCVATRLVEYRRRHTPGSAYLIDREWPDKGPVEYRIQEPKAEHLDDLWVPLELMVGISFEGIQDSSDLFRVQALAWFFKAAELHRNSDTKAFDLLFEVVKALQMARELRIWRDAEKEEGMLAIRNLAKEGAARAHAKHNQRAENIRAWWLENKNRFKSLDQAAERASREFSCAFRTAREHIGRANKELRSAGKA